MKRNYRQAKKQKEAARKARQAEKQQRRQLRAADADNPAPLTVEDPALTTHEDAPPESA